MGQGTPVSGSGATIRATGSADLNGSSGGTRRLQYREQVVGHRRCRNDWDGDFFANLGAQLASSRRVRQHSDHRVRTRRALNGSRYMGVNHQLSRGR
jgi:hypothetical protein